MPRPENCPKVTVLICTLNEEENLPHVLPKIPKWVDEIILVDGHSADNTVEVAQKLRPEIKAMQQPGEGKGNALRYGAQQASGEIVVMLDADGSTNPDDIPKFLEPLLNGYDFAKGSRFLDERPEMPRIRYFGNQVFISLTNVLFRTKYTDLCAGMNAFQRNILAKVDPKGNSYLDEPTLNIRLKKKGIKVKEVHQLDRGRICGQPNETIFKQGWRIFRIIITERFRV